MSVRSVHLFLDMDGVLCDFEAGFQSFFGSHPDDLPQADMWDHARNHRNYYGELPWMWDGPLLWEYANHHFECTMNTACPRGNWAQPQKRFWVQQNLGDHPAITTRKPQKAEEAVRFSSRKMGQLLSQPQQGKKPCPAQLNLDGGDDQDLLILVDDRPEAATRWEQMGGTFVHHTSSKNTIAQLEEILKEVREASGGEVPFGVRTFDLPDSVWQWKVRCDQFEAEAGTVASAAAAVNAGAAAAGVEGKSPLSGRASM